MINFTKPEYDIPLSSFSLGEKCFCDMFSEPHKVSHPKLIILRVPVYPPVLAVTIQKHSFNLFILTSKLIKNEFIFFMIWNNLYFYQQNDPSPMPCHS